MNENCKTSLRFIDGKPAPNFNTMKENEFERCLWKDYGYTMVPNDNVTSITKDDLVNHPEKFKPFKYSRLLSSSGCTYDELIGRLRYHNGNWRYGNGVRKLAVGELRPTISEEVLYIERYYPELYKKLIQKNNTIYTEKEGVKSKIKAHHATAPTITPDQVNAEINYPHISESSDLKL